MRAYDTCHGRMATLICTTPGSRTSPSSPKRRREVPLVREARLGLLAREAMRLAEEGGDA